jgi:hypothetical protein
VSKCSAGWGGSWVVVVAVCCVHETEAGRFLDGLHPTRSLGFSSQRDLETQSK